jgi:hypothetical protein
MKVVSYGLRTNILRPEFIAALAWAIHAYFGRRVCMEIAIPRSAPVPEMHF